MRGLVLFLCLCLFAVSALKKKRRNRSKNADPALYCKVCLAWVHEAMTEIDATRHYEVTTRFRLDEKTKVPYARTEGRLMEIFEEVIPLEILKYKKTKSRADGTFDLKKTGSHEDVMGRLGTKVLDGHEEELVRLFSHQDVTKAEAHRQACVVITKACDEIPTHIPPYIDPPSFDNDMESAAELAANAAELVAAAEEMSDPSVAKLAAKLSKLSAAAAELSAAAGEEEEISAPPLSIDEELAKAKQENMKEGL